MESEYDLGSLPVPRDSKVERRQVEAGKVFAAWSFSGLPLDFEVNSFDCCSGLCHTTCVVPTSRCFELM